MLCVVLILLGLAGTVLPELPGTLLVSVGIMVGIFCRRLTDLTPDDNA